MTADAVGGVWTYATSLGARLVRAGHQVVLAVMGPPPDASQRADARAAGVELRVGHYLLEWQYEPWDDVAKAGTWLLELERELAPDVVHLNGFAHGALPFRAPKLVVAHSCVASWWQAVHGESTPASKDRYLRETARGLAGADVVVAPSRSMLEALRLHYGVPGAARVIHNGLPAPRAAAKERPREPIVLCAGRLDDLAKNVGCAVEAAAGLPWPMVFAGTAPTAPSRGVTWLGRVPRSELLAWFERTSIFVAPARYEPFGLVALEAALAGCALVLGDIPSLRELWGGAAVFIDPDSPRALRDALTRLAENEPLRQALSRRAQQRARRYSMWRMAAEYTRIYHALAGIGAAATSPSRPPAHERSSCESSFSAIPSAATGITATRTSFAES